MTRVNDLANIAEITLRFSRNRSSLMKHSTIRDLIVIIRPLPNAFHAPCDFHVNRSCRSLTLLIVFSFFPFVATSQSEASRESTRVLGGSRGDDFRPAYPVTIIMPWLLDSLEKTLHWLTFATLNYVFLFFLYLSLGFFNGRCRFRLIEGWSVQPFRFVLELG